MSENGKREKALAALVSNPNVRTAAASCGIGERTLHRWVREPEFAMQLAEARRDVTRRVMLNTISRAEKAAEVLDEIMSNKKFSPHARVQAAKSLLELSFRAAEIDEILNRIESLEMAHNEALQ